MSRHSRLIAPLLALVFAAPLGAAESTTMKAIRYDTYGPASVLHYQDVPKPEPGAGEVLVRVQAAGVNPIDWKLRKGRGGSPAPAAPVTPGFDIAGEVAALAPGVVGFKPGDAVFARLQRQDGYAEYVTVPVDDLVRTPSNIDAVHAAAIPIAADTAWQALFDEGGLSRGQTVLIHGAAGGVGHFAVQLAKHAGARVIGTASANHADFLKALGADVAIDYRTEKFEDIAKDVDLVLDTVGGDTLARSYGVVRKGGAVVTIVTRADPAELAKHGLRTTHGSETSHLREIAKLVEEGAVKPEVGATFPLEQAQAAHELSETGHARGKIVLVVGH